MTLFDKAFERGAITAVGGDAETHRRLVDLGLVGAECTVKARRKSAVLVAFDDFSAVVGVTAARMIETVEKK